jgi:hypothetical protein
MKRTLKNIRLSDNVINVLPFVDGKIAVGMYSQTIYKPYVISLYFSGAFSRNIKNNMRLKIKSYNL